MSHSVEKRSEYMDEATNNVNKLDPKKNNTVACVDCQRIYETKTLRQIHNCLCCSKCGTDAIMVIIPGSQLYGLSKAEQEARLLVLHNQGFTPLSPKKSSV